MFYKVFIIIFSSILLVPNFMQKERRRFEERAEEKFVILRFPNTPHQIFTKQNTIVGLFAWISFPSSTSDNNIFIWNFYSERTDRKLEWILNFFKKKNKNWHYNWTIQAKRKRQFQSDSMQLFECNHLFSTISINMKTYLWRRFHAVNLLNVCFLVEDSFISTRLFIF